jgi:hypothetical protein
VIAFGSRARTQQLLQIAGASRNGKLHMSTDTSELATIFMDIVLGGQDVALLLAAEIGKQVSDAVIDKILLEYMA